MKIPTLALSTALVAIGIGLTSPAFAQHRRGGGDGNHGSNRSSESHGTAVPRAARPPAPAPAPAPVPRVDNGSRVMPPRSYGAAVPRSYPSVRGDAYRNYGYRNDGGHGGGYRSYGYPSYSYRGYDRHGYSYHAPVRFYRPYYSFRPRFSIGFGLWVGYPVPYAYAYYDPFYYGYPYPYPSTVYPSTVYPSTVYPSNPYPAYPPATGYPPSSYPQSAYPPNADPNSIGVQPGQANTGGLSFDITPADAAILVDGAYVGTVGQFTPSTQPLGLPAGRHRIEIQAAGYRTMSFDVDIVAGQVLPYQGTMESR